jgi:hypothetical protein
VGNGVVVNVGQESSVTLDASASYDADFPDSGSQFTFMWTCPSEMSGCDGIKSTLTISKAMRVAVGYNNIGSTFRIGVQIYSPRKQSALTYVTVNVIKQIYKDCMTVTLENSVNGAIQISRD